MVDIETLGLERGCVVLSIGAVLFDEVEVYDEDGTFYRNIDMQSCTDRGLEIHTRTLQWWLEQDEEAQDCLVDGDDLEDVLRRFSLWYDGNDVSEIWANSPAMDCEVLEGAYDACGMDEPWEYHEERDMRTIESIAGDVPKVEAEVKHNALDDAIRQATTVSQILSQI
jgi:hypothetical protein